MFKHLGFSDEESERTIWIPYGSLFEYGLHLMEVSLSDLIGFIIIGGQENIRDFIAFPKK